MSVAATSPLRPAILVVAGSDSSGGAGLQADLRTCAAFNVHATSVITAVTAQTDNEVRAVHAVPAEVIAAQLDAAFDTRAIGAVKLGLLARAPTVTAVADSLRRRPSVPVVLDPVMIASSGGRLLDAEALAVLREQLLPKVDCLTPNLAEAAALLGGDEAGDEAAMQAQGRALLAVGPRAVLVKGGHAALPEAVDLLVSADGVKRFASPWVRAGRARGTGCTLSTAIAAALAHGAPLAQAVAQAKRHLGTVLAAPR